MDVLTLMTSKVLMREERRPRGSGSAKLAINHELGNALVAVALSESVRHLQADE